MSVFYSWQKAARETIETTAVDMFQHREVHYGLQDLDPEVRQSSRANALIVSMEQVKVADG